MEINTVIGVQILDDIVGISRSVNILGKGMNTTIFLPAMGKWHGRLGSLTLVWLSAKKKESSEFKLVKNWPARAVGLVNTHFYYYYYHNNHNNNGQIVGKTEFEFPTLVMAC